MSTIFRVEKNANFTVMSNIHLKDRRLSYKAKGLMSEILSLPNDWDYTLAGLAVIANDGVDSVRSAVRELERYGYLVRSQRRDRRGCMSVNEYRVYENPAENPAYIPEDESEGKSDVDNSVENVSSGSASGNSLSLENPITARKSVKARDFFENPSTADPSTDLPLSENPTTATFNKLNNQVLNTHQSNHSINRRADARSEDRIDRIFSQEPDLTAKERDYYREVIKSNIEYDYFVENKDNPVVKVDLSKVNELVSIMVDVVCSNRKTIRVNGGEIPQEVVKRRFLELDSSHIDYVLDAMKANTSEVRNIRAYLVTALYNAPETIDSFYDAWVKHDLYGGK